MITNKVRFPCSLIVVHWRVTSARVCSTDIEEPSPSPTSFVSPLSHSESISFLSQSLDLRSRVFSTGATIFLNSPHTIRTISTMHCLISRLSSWWKKRRGFCGERRDGEGSLITSTASSRNNYVQHLCTANVIWNYIAEKFNLCLSKCEGLIILEFVRGCRKNGVLRTVLAVLIKASLRVEVRRPPDTHVR